MKIRRTSELKFPDEYADEWAAATRLIDNKFGGFRNRTCNQIWLRDELKKLRGRAARRRSQHIKDILHEVHRPWHER